MYRMITGLTHKTNRSHIARAALEGVCLRTWEVCLVTWNVDCNLWYADCEVHVGGLWCSTNTIKS